jgi:hypothetical protein
MVHQSGELHILVRFCRLSLTLPPENVLHSQLF